MGKERSRVDLAIVQAPRPSLRAAQNVPPKKATPGDCKYVCVLWCFIVLGSVGFYQCLIVTYILLSMELCKTKYSRLGTMSALRFYSNFIFRSPGFHLNMGVWAPLQTFLGINELGVPTGAFPVFTRYVVMGMVKTVERTLVSG